MAKGKKLPTLHEIEEFMEQQKRINEFVRRALAPQPRVPAAQLIQGKMSGQWNRRDGNKFGKPPHE